MLYCIFVECMYLDSLARRCSRCRLDEAIRSAHEDKLFETNDVDVLMKSLKER